MSIHSIAGKCCQTQNMIIYEYSVSSSLHSSICVHVFRHEITVLPIERNTCYPTQRVNKHKSWHDLIAYLYMENWAHNLRLCRGSNLNFGRRALLNCSLSQTLRGELASMRRRFCCLSNKVSKYAFICFSGIWKKNPGCFVRFSQLNVHGRLEMHHGRKVKWRHLFQNFTSIERKSIFIDSYF